MANKPEADSHFVVVMPTLHATHWLLKADSHLPTADSRQLIQKCLWVVRITIHY